MCPWVGPHAPSFGRQLWGLPSRVEYLSPQGVLLPLVYGSTASPLWLELRGHSAWQVTPSWTVYRLASHRLLPWLRVTFAMVPDAAWTCSDQWPWSTAPATGPVGRLGRPSASDPWGVGSFLSLGRPTCVQCPGPLGSCSPVCPRSLLCCVCGVLGHLARVHRCARSVCCVACAVSWATWLPFTGTPAECVVLRVRFSRATWLLFTGAPARCVALRVRCLGPLGCCSPTCPLGVWCCVCGVLGHLPPVHRRARAVCCVACTASWASWLLFTAVSARCVVLRVWRPGPLGLCSPVCPLSVLCCVCGVLGHLAPVHRCDRSVCCFACAVSRAWLGGGARVCGPACLPSALPAVSSSAFPLLLSFCLLVLLCFFFGGGRLGGGVFGSVRGCGSVPVPVLVWAWVPWGTGVGWLSRSGFPVCAPAPRLPVSRAPVPGVLTAGGWRLWWRGACVGGRSSWVAPGWRGRARARGGVCSWRGPMGWPAVWARLVCVGVGYVCAEGVVGWAGALWAMQWVEEMLVTPTGGVL